MKTEAHSDTSWAFGSRDKAVSTQDPCSARDLPVWLWKSYFPCPYLHLQMEGCWTRWFLKSFPFQQSIPTSRCCKIINTPPSPQHYPGKGWKGGSRMRSGSLWLLTRFRLARFPRFKLTALIKRLLLPFPYFCNTFLLHTKINVEKIRKQHA